MQAGAPYCPVDFWILQFLRTYSDCIITTGKILRKEPDAFDTKVLKAFELNPEVYFENSKPLAILTNTLNKNLMEVGNKVYADTKYRKHLLTK